MNPRMAGGRPEPENTGHGGKKDNAWKWPSPHANGIGQLCAHLQVARLQLGRVAADGKMHSSAGTSPWA